MPELLRALAGVIPSGPNVFVEVTPDFEPRYAILEDPMPDLLELFIRERHGAFRRELDAIGDWWRRHPGPVHWQHERAILDVIYRSDMYYHLLRPMGQHYALEGLISEQGRPLGRVELFRAESECPFNARDAAELRYLLPHIAHGLKARPDQDSTFVGSGRLGHIILDGSGRLMHQSDTAKTLLYLLTHPQGSEANPEPGLSPAALFKKLADDLSAIARGREASPPVIYRQNPWGLFVFRAYRLDDTLNMAAALTLVTIEHQEPLPLRLLRGLRTLPLSAKEREICFGLARGQSLTAAAMRLGVKPGTAKKYADAAYVKLGIHHRAELSEKIMAEGLVGRHGAAYHAE
jgi:DNA-binding CsgD family transcriptional regulator